VNLYPDESMLAVEMLGKCAPVTEMELQMVIMSLVESLRGRRFILNQAAPLWYSRRRSLQQAERLLADVLHERTV
jgi:hypothetical protein